MDIKKTTSVSPLQSVPQKKPVDKATHVAEKSNDSVVLTKDAERQALYQKAMKIIANTPDIRTEKVEIAKKSLKKYDNPSDEVLNEVAKKILDGFAT